MGRSVQNRENESSGAPRAGGRRSRALDAKQTLGSPNSPGGRRGSVRTRVGIVRAIADPRTLCFFSPFLRPCSFSTPVERRTERTHRRCGRPDLQSPPSIFPTVHHARHGERARRGGHAGRAVTEAFDERLQQNAALTPPHKNRTFFIKRFCVTRRERRCSNFAMQSDARA